MATQNTIFEVRQQPKASLIDPNLILAAKTNPLDVNLDSYMQGVKLGMLPQQMELQQRQLELKDRELLSEEKIAEMKYDYLAQQLAKQKKDAAKNHIESKVTFNKEATDTEFLSILSPTDRNELLRDQESLSSMITRAEQGQYDENQINKEAASFNLSRLNNNGYLKASRRKNALQKLLTLKDKVKGTMYESKLSKFLADYQNGVIDPPPEAFDINNFINNDEEVLPLFNNVIKGVSSTTSTSRIQEYDDGSKAEVLEKSQKPADAQYAEAWQQLSSNPTIVREYKKKADDYNILNSEIGNSNANMTWDKLLQLDINQGIQNNLINRPTSASDVKVTADISNIKSPPKTSTSGSSVSAKPVTPLTPFKWSVDDIETSNTLNAISDPITKTYDIIDIKKDNQGQYIVSTRHQAKFDKMQEELYKNMESDPTVYIAYKNKAIAYNNYIKEQGISDKFPEVTAEELMKKDAKNKALHASISATTETNTVTTNIKTGYSNKTKGTSTKSGGSKSSSGSYSGSGLNSRYIEKGTSEGARNFNGLLTVMDEQGFQIPDRTTREKLRRYYNKKEDGSYLDRGDIEIKTIHNPKTDEIKQIYLYFSNDYPTPPDSKILNSSDNIFKIKNIEAFKNANPELYEYQKEQMVTFKNRNKKKTTPKPTTSNTQNFNSAGNAAFD